ncbi:hypothetical protein T484DRAFT_1943949 [Baffinella frigidus]|nr:hypothetical protein T484DRAFT_1943949 [Cryptophyta sp. CCMP2293]
MPRKTHISGRRAAAATPDPTYTPSLGAGQASAGPAPVGLWEGFARGGRDFLWGVSEQVAATGIEDKINEMRMSLRNAARDSAIKTREALNGARTALEDRIEDIADPGAAAWRSGGGGGVMRPNVRAGTAMTERVGDVWEAFFSHMFTSVDTALIEGWITKEDIAEPFLMLGMPAAAAMELVLLSAPKGSGVTLTSRLHLTPEDMVAPAFVDARPLFQEVAEAAQALKAAGLPTDGEKVFLRRSAMCASAKEVPHSIPDARRRVLNLILARVQGIAIKVTQQKFYKDQSEAIIQEMASRE